MQTHLFQPLVHKCILWFSHINWDKPPCTRDCTTHVLRPCLHWVNFCSFFKSWFQCQGICEALPKLHMLTKWSIFWLPHQCLDNVNTFLLWVLIEPRNSSKQAFVIASCNHVCVLAPFPHFRYLEDRLCFTHFFFFF